MTEQRLDHTSYPHIFDAILDAAPLESSVALRGTSRAIRARVDAKIYPHVALTPTASGYELRDAVLARLPCPALGLGERLKPDKVLEARFAHMRVVDLHAPDGLPFPPTPNLELVRRALPGPCALVAPTLVDYVDLSAPRPSRAGYGSAADITLTMPPGVKRHVVHVTFATWQSPTLKLALGHPESVEELTVVLSPAAPAKSGVQGKAAPLPLGDHVALRRVITGILAASTFHLMGGGHVTFVSSGPYEEGDALVGSAAAELDALLGLIPWFGHKGGVAKLVGYVPHDEWLASLGDRLVAERLPAAQTTGRKEAGPWATTLHKPFPRPEHQLTWLRVPSSWHGGDLGGENEMEWV